MSSHDMSGKENSPSIVSKRVGFANVVQDSKRRHLAEQRPNDSSSKKSTSQGQKKSSGGFGGAAMTLVKRNAKDRAIRKSLKEQKEAAERAELVATYQENTEEAELLQKDVNKYQHQLDRLSTEYMEQKERLSLVKEQHNGMKGLINQAKQKNTRELAFYQSKVEQLAAKHEARLSNLEAVNTKALQIEIRARHEEELTSLEKEIVVLRKKLAKQKNKHATELSHLKAERRARFMQLAEQLHVDAHSVCADLNRQYRHMEVSLQRGIIRAAKQNTQTKDDLVEILNKRHEASLESTRKYYEEMSGPHRIAIHSLQDQLQGWRDRIKRNVARVADEDARYDETHRKYMQLQHEHRNLVHDGHAFERNATKLKHMRAKELVVKDAVARQQWENDVWRKEIVVMAKDRDALYAELVNTLKVLKAKRIQLDATVSDHAQRMASVLQAEEAEAAAATDNNDVKAHSAETDMRRGPITMTTIAESGPFSDETGDEAVDVKQIQSNAGGYHRYNPSQSLSDFSPNDA